MLNSRRFEVLVETLTQGEPPVTPLEVGAGAGSALRIGRHGVGVPCCPPGLQGYHEIEPVLLREENNFKLHVLTGEVVMGFFSREVCQLFMSCSRFFGRSCVLRQLQAHARRALS